MRYVAIRPKAWVSYQESPESRPTGEVLESDAAPINTGLVTADGVPLYRMQERGPLGFCRTEAKS